MPNADKAIIEAAALAEPNVARFVEGQTIVKVVVVAGKLVNVVIKYISRAEFAVSQHLFAVGADLLSVLFSIQGCGWRLRGSMDVKRW